VSFIPGSPGADRGGGSQAHPLDTEQSRAKRFSETARRNFYSKRNRQSYDFARTGKPGRDRHPAVTFKPVGPVARAFINDRMFISSIMGPYGSAKTTSCFQKILNARCGSPGPDGVRRIRVCVIRATYAQLKTNVMADWFSWFPKTTRIGTASR
jgi:hypothetical protein